MEKLMRTRFFKYLVAHYERMPEAKLLEMIEISKKRISDLGLFSVDVLKTVIEEMKEEGIPMPNIMAHLDLLDIEERT